ncbi:hypothetical protein ACLMJK_004449 [Lecanora helva]
MPITFGAIGDIISLCILIKDLVKCLDECRGSSAEYQAVTRELQSLESALREVEKLLRSCEGTAELITLATTIQACANQCYKTVEGFRQQIDNFQPLHNGHPQSLFKKTTFKIRWQISEKADLVKFRAEINAQCSFIEMLLTAMGLKLITRDHETLNTYVDSYNSTRSRSEAAQASGLANIETRLEEVNVSIKAWPEEVKKLCSNFDIGYFKDLGTKILSFLQRIWMINFMTYRAVISLQNAIPAQLERSWTQEPAVLDDALGRVTPIHLEFLDSWEAFDRVLECRFRHLPGHQKIKEGHYVLRSRQMKRDLNKSLAIEQCFLPGQRIDMSVIFNARPFLSASCPGCNLVTDQTQDQFGSQVQW